TARTASSWCSPRMMGRGTRLRSTRLPLQTPTPSAPPVALVPAVPLALLAFADGPTVEVTADAVPGDGTRRGAAAADAVEVTYDLTLAVAVAPEAAVSGAVAATDESAPDEDTAPSGDPPRAADVVPAFAAPRSVRRVRSLSTSLRSSATRIPF